MHDASGRLNPHPHEWKMPLLFGMSVGKINFFISYASRFFKKKGSEKYGMSRNKNKGGLQMSGVRTLAAFVPGMKARPWISRTRRAPSSDTEPG